MAGTIEEFARELKSLIAKNKFSLEEVNQALAMICLDMEEDKKKAQGARHKAQGKSGK